MSELWDKIIVQTNQSNTVLQSSFNLGDGGTNGIRPAKPSDLTAEKALLGSIILNGKLLDELTDILLVEHFYDPGHKWVYKACVDLWRTNSPTDVVYLLQKFAEYAKDKNDPVLEKMDLDYLLDILSYSSLSSSVQATAKILKDKFLLRTIVETGEILVETGYKGGIQPVDLLDSAQQKLYEISLQTIERNFVPISEILVDTFERISQLYQNQGELRGVPTGFTDLDRILGGLHNSDLVILAARPSMGKTSLALEITKRVALNSKTPVAIFSLEMSKDQLVDKILTSLSGIDAYKIRSGRLQENNENSDFARLGEAIGILNDAPIWVDDGGSLNILELRSKARRLKSRHGIGLIIIDYLQLMAGRSDRGYNGNRVQEVSDISRGLKMLAKELNIPILALSQLSRSVEGRDDKRPMLSDLRESGSIEQDADVVMFVHREEMYHKETKKKGIADILISKHRNGQTGAIELAWVDRLATFENLDGGRTRRSTGE
jgi:replicative DNA helicase